MADRIWCIQKCRLFEQLPASDLSFLESRARVKKFPGNSSIYFPSDAAESVFVLVEGRIDSTRSLPTENKRSLRLSNPASCSVNSPCWVPTNVTNTHKRWVRRELSRFARRCRDSLTPKCGRVPGNHQSSSECGESGWNGDYETCFFDQIENVWSDYCANCWNSMVEKLMKAC